MNHLHVATAGLFAAWLAHDLEELATMSATSRVLAKQLPDWVPVPAPVRQRGLTQRYLATGVSAVGLLIAAATARGYRTRGRSAFYQNVLLGFGLHGLGTSARACSHAATRVVLRPLPRSSFPSGCGQPGLCSGTGFRTDTAFGPRSQSSQEPSPAAISPRTCSPRTSPEPRDDRFPDQRHAD